MVGSPAAGRWVRAGRLGLLLVVVTACAGRLPDPISDWPLVTANLDGRPVRLVVAIDRQQGLQGIDQLTGADGMLFDFGREVEPATARFWMRDVLTPLDIAWFDGDGRLVGRASMSTCELDCPTYEAPGPFRWVVESPAGTIALSDGATLDAPD